MGILMYHFSEINFGIVNLKTLKCISTMMYPK